MFDLNRKSILITGATGYLGSQLAIGLSQLGAFIYVNSRDEDRCQKLVQKIEASGGLASVASFDVTEQSEVISFISSIDLLDVLVNNSYAGAGGTIKSAETEHYLNSYHSSVVASANLVKLLIPKFKVAVRKSGYASVINIASIYGMVSPDHSIYSTATGTNPPFYGAAKAALIQWTKYAACEFAKDKIRFNSISPGAFPSSDSQTKTPELVQNIISKVPMGRIGQPSELVGPVSFLSSQASSYVTGTNIPVDGGWTAW